jgi:predicted transcriptional regulator
MATMTIRLNRRESARISMLAKKRRVTRSQLVRDALAQLESVNAGNIGDDWGDFIGAVKRGPADLATNPRHLARFGRWRK